VRSAGGGEERLRGETTRRDCEELGAHVVNIFSNFLKFSQENGHINNTYHVDRY
jgi:hypothetical protein